MEHLMDMPAPATETPEGALIPQDQVKNVAHTLFSKTPMGKRAQHNTGILAFPSPASFCLFLFFLTGKRKGRKSFEAPPAD